VDIPNVFILQRIVPFFYGFGAKICASFRPSDRHQFHDCGAERRLLSDHDATMKAKIGRYVAVCHQATLTGNAKAVPERHFTITPS